MLKHMQMQRGEPAVGRQPTLERSTTSQELVRSITGSPRVKRMRVLAIEIMAVVTLLMGAVTLCTSIVAAALMKDSRVNEDGELVTSNGSRVRTVASVVRSYSTLAELPAQSMSFLEQMTGVSLWMADELRFFRVVGFRWSNLSYMVLETATMAEVIVAGGKAFLKERDVNGRLVVTHATVPASEPECGRRLSVRGSPSLHSFEDVAARYHAETASLPTSEAGLWRRIQGEEQAHTELYKWFGALASSEAPSEALGTMAGEALNQAFCQFDTKGLECAAFESSREPAPPRLDDRGWNRFLLAGNGTTWLLYLDLSGSNLRSKLVEGVLGEGDDPTGTALRVVESDQSTVWAYEMMHPYVNPMTYNLTLEPHRNDRLTLAEELLESALFEDHKGACRSFHAGPSGSRSTEVERPQHVSVTFDCDSGTYLWSVAGWRVLASPDGEIRAFLLGGEATNTSSDGVALDEDDESVDKHLQYRVLARADGSDARNHFRLNKAFEEGSIFGRCPLSGGVDSGERRLRKIGARLPGSNWCGPGQDPKRDNFCLSPTFDGDWACRRHDSCARWAYLGPLPVVGCSCDRDLDAARGSGYQAGIIHALYGDMGVWPCLAHLDHCRKWGWKEGGRRRRWGWSYWGAKGEYECVNWNYIHKYSGQLTQWGYRGAINNFDLHSSEDWPGCGANTRDFPSVEWFAGWGVEP